MSIIALTIILFFVFQHYLPTVTQDDLWYPEMLGYYQQFHSDTVAILILSYAIAFPLGLIMEGWIAKGLEKIRFKREDWAILRVLTVANENDGYITAVDVAAKTTLSLTESQKILDDLHNRGYADLSVAKTGDILYCFPGFSNRDE